MSICKLRGDLIEDGLSVPVRQLNLKNTEIDWSIWEDKWLKELFPENEKFTDFLQSDFELNEAGHTLMIAHKGKVFSGHSIDFDFEEVV